MRKCAALGAMVAIVTLGTQTAAAEGFSYSFLEGAYVLGDVDGLDLDGFGIRGSTELAPAVHVFSGMQNLDFEDIDAQLDSLNVGVGLNWALSDNLDLVGGASFERLNVAGFSESGFGVSAGMRGRLAERFELTANLKYSDIGDYGDTFTYAAGGRFYFTPSFAAGVDYNKIDLGDFEGGIDGEAWLISLRYDFGDRY